MYVFQLSILLAACKQLYIITRRL